VFNGISASIRLGFSKSRRHNPASADALLSKEGTNRFSQCSKTQKTVTNHDQSPLELTGCGAHFTFNLAFFGYHRIA